MRLRLRFLALTIATLSAFATAGAVPASAGTAPTTKVRIDLLDCNGDTAAPIDETTWNAAATASAVGGVQTVCATAFGASDVVVTTSITFTIMAGPGRFTDAAGVANNGSAVTVTHSGGYSTAYITSSATGTTEVRAAVSTILADGTKVWSAAAARTLGLGTPTGTSSSTMRAVTGTVRDQFGNGVPGVTVTFGTSGVGSLSSAAQLVTDSGGQVTAVAQRSSDETGTQTVSAAISAASTDCERAAGDPAGAPAGVCNTSVAITWTTSTTSLTIAVNPIHGVWGTDFAITGVLTAGSAPVSGRIITVEKREVGAAAFTVLDTGVTENDGSFLVIDRAARNAFYRARYSGDNQAAGALSGLAGIGVRVGVILNASPSRLPAGSIVGFTGRVLPEHPGRPIYLQQYSPSLGWRTIGESRLSPQSTYSFRLLKRTAGFLLFRAVTSSDADHLWNTSTNRRIDWV